MKKLITTTTNNLEGWNIKEYLQPISSNIVVGANIFSEFSASISDFFGGRSGSYEKKLQQIYDQSILNLQNKARSLGANAVIGLKIDIDEISGKGSQMFMITSYGTPVSAVRIENEKPLLDQSKDLLIDGSYVQNKVTAKRIIERVNKTERLESSDLQFISENPYPEFIECIFALLKRSAPAYMAAEIESITNRCAAFFSNIDPDLAIERLYDQFHMSDNSHNFLVAIGNIIKTVNLIDYPSIKKLISSGDLKTAKFGLSILLGDKAYYSQNDKIQLQDLNKLISESCKPVGVISSKKGFLSGEKDVWTCACNKVNSMTDNYCSSCKDDINGFKEDEMKPAEVAELIQDRLHFIN